MKNDKIEEFLNIASRHYYNGDPIISDQQFDILSEYINYNKIGAKQDNVDKHLYPMYSLQKFYENEGKKNPLVGYTDIDISPKLDGAALSLLYVNGNLYKVLTRGDGVWGQIVTDKFTHTKLVPKTINLAGVVQITGELAAPVHIPNARNYAAGSLNLKSVEEFKTKAVTFFAYNIQPYQNSTFYADMVLLKDLGFSTIKDQDIHKIYPCDGMVYRLNKYAEFETLGYTSKYPRGAYALKERNSAVETTLLDVEWQVGKTGKVTPVAILEPVQVGDAIVSRATLNNIAYIKALDLHIGDKVGVVRSGEIIPQVVHKIM